MDFKDGRPLVMDELARSLAAIDAEAVEAARALLLDGDRLFVAAAGRSALALRMAAMRWMHLGLTVHVAGETTTPRLMEGDVLIVASASGTTAGVVQSVEVAARVGASVLTLTGNPDAAIVARSTAVILVTAASKHDRGDALSRQYAGSLFEQSVLLTLDMLFHAMWTASGLSRDQLWANHANLE